MYSNNLWEQLLRSTPTQTSVTEALQNLLEREISIPQGIRSKASDSQNYLREFLASEHQRDSSFPRLLSSSDSDFLGGSFARHSKIWPLDDVDIYLPLDGFGLFYTSWGNRLPYTVLTDGGLSLNPLTYPRWMTGGFVQSADLVRGFAEVLKRRYPKTEIRPNGQCVSVRLTVGETEGESGLGFDVVPCFSLKPDDTKEVNPYLIPNGQNGWIHSNPRFDTYISQFLHNKHAKLFHSIVRLVKWWNKEKLGSAFGSYYIELALMRGFLPLQPITSLSEGLKTAFALLASAYLGGSLTSWVTGAPPVTGPALTRSQSTTLNLASERAKLACDWEALGNIQRALESWSVLFEDLT